MGFWWVFSKVPTGCRVSSWDPRSLPGRTSDFLSAAPSDTAAPPSEIYGKRWHPFKPFLLDQCADLLWILGDVYEEIHGFHPVPICRNPFWHLQDRLPIIFLFTTEPHSGYVPPWTWPISKSLTRFFSPLEWPFEWPCSRDSSTILGLPCQNCQSIIPSPSCQGESRYPHTTLRESTISNISIETHPSIDDSPIEILHS